jgi:hypothetical protein
MTSFFTFHNFIFWQGKKEKKNKAIGKGGGGGEIARIEVLRYLLTYLLPTTTTKFKSLKNRADPDIWANC